ncbi:MAG TPA: glycosyltransferase family 4 protein [Acidobacteriaceae bacterium]|nr:glycosyltransferase family 4 protein [Acidobacteriaceae bacterium]
MIIGKIWDSEYPWDVRVEKVTSALMDAGHEVHLFCRNRKGQPEREHIGNLDVHRMPNWPRAGTWLDDISSFPAFVSPRWIRHVLRTAREVHVNLLLCRDLPLAPLALWIGHRLDVPVVVDIAENYPAMLKHRYHPREFKVQNLLVRNPLFAAVVERFVVRRADGILVVVDESRDRLLRLGTAADRVEVVCNTPTVARIRQMEQSAGQRASGCGPLRLVYLGLLGITRGIDVTLRALHELDARGVDIHLDVIGSLRGEHDYAADASSLGIAHRVTFHGEMPYDTALRIVAVADVGLVPHHATEHWRTTIPNKLFDYMAGGLPVLVSDAPPTKRIVNETSCGLVFRDRDPADLAARVMDLVDVRTRQRMGVAGREAVLERYNWGRDGMRLVQHLENVHDRAAGTVARVSAPALPLAPEALGSLLANLDVDTTARGN